MGGVSKPVANKTSTTTRGLTAYWKIQNLCTRGREDWSLEPPKGSDEKQNNPSKSGGAKRREERDDIERGGVGGGGLRVDGEGPHDPD